MRTWEAVPERLRPRLLEAAAKAAADLAPEIAKADEGAVSVMRKYGLRVIEIPSAARAEWEGVVSRGLTLLEGTAYDLPRSPRRGRSSRSTGHPARGAETAAKES